MRIYVASSWRNAYQQEVVKVLRECGHQVYDFRNPEPGNTGFHWSEIDPEWKAWDPQLFRQALRNPIAADGFDRDMRALTDCEVCVLVLPCGRSAHLEAGIAAGSGKSVIIFIPEPSEPELMYSACRKIVVDTHELVFAVADCEKKGGER